MRTRTSSTLMLLIAAALLGSALLPLAGRAQAPAKPADDTTALYKKHCLVCHGADGDSKMPGMSFVDGEWKHGTSEKEIAAVIRDGVKGSAMLPFKNKLTEPEITALTSYVRAFDPKLKKK